MPNLIYDTSATQQAPLGDELQVGTDRVFRYCKNGPAALTVGTVLQGPLPNASHSNLACAAALRGATAVTLTFAAGDPVTLNQYKEGYLYINDGATVLASGRASSAAGEGFLYDVKSHPGGGGEDTTKKVTIKDPVVVALTTSSQATLIPNPYSGVNKPFGDPWDILVGVNPVAVAVNEYFWAQVRGPAIVLQEGALFAGRGVMASQEVPGAVSVLKQVVPVTGSRGTTSLMGGVDRGPSTPGAQKEYSQKALVRRPSGTGRFDDDELLENFSGRATVPERVIGYCINPRVSTEHALVYLTLS
ncbi:hypothetical protein LCGC14_1799130 [marine sediment metagenome]|uniref:Uncharacterized protein n=1 Tax=marine sediment metagenome TaxID=412755 RepID=A0A0F9GQ99_9ZZZZ